MTTLPIDEAAAQVGVTEATIRQWVARGYIEPVRPGAKPLRFDEFALTQCAMERMPMTRHEELDALWTRAVDL